MVDKEISISPFCFKTDNQNTRIMSRAPASLSVNSPDIAFETVHPDDYQKNFIWTFIKADHFFTSLYSYHDSGNPKNYQQLHYHEYFELIYIISGTMYQQIESERHLYTAGSLCLLNCFVSHQEEYSTDYRALFLRLPISLVKSLLEDMNNYYFEIERAYKNQLLEQFFTDNLDFPETSYFLRKEYIDFIPVKEKREVRQYMYNLFDTLTKQMVNPEIGSTYIIKCTLIQLLCELSNPSHYRIVPLNIGTDAETLLFNSIRTQIKIKHGHISRKELEETLSYNGTYMNRIVKKYSGSSLKQFALSIAMKEAVDMLQNTDMQITEICDTLQFTNQTYFYSSFQKIYGMTPKKYRENFRATLGTSTVSNKSP